jgi:hypothetical protein
MGMARLEELLAFELFAPLDFPGFLSAGAGFSDESIISNEAGIVLFLVGRCKRIEGRTDKMPVSKIHCRARFTCRNACISLISSAFRAKLLRVFFAWRLCIFFRKRIDQLKKNRHGKHQAHQSGLSEDQEYQV